MMNSYGSMTTKLSKTGLYDIKGGSNISNELNSYSAALEVMYNELKVMERELFIDTAYTYGISNREKFFGKERVDKSLAQRRDILRAFEQMTGKCTVKAFENTVRSYGVSDFTIKEDFAGSKVTIEVKGTFSQAEKESIEGRVKEDFPAHLNVAVNYV